MKFYPHKIVIIIVALFFLAIQHSYSQDQDNKWVIGVGVNVVDFYPTNESSSATGNNGGFFSGITNAKDHWNVSAPSINVSRHIKNRFSADASLSMNKISKVGDFEVDNLSYFAVDIAAQYDILDSSKKLRPYVYAGTGYTWVDSKGWGTINIGLGSNYWFNDKFGVKINAIYKHSGEDKVDKLLSHFQYSLSVVLKLNGRKRGIGTDCPK